VAIGKTAPVGLTHLIALNALHSASKHIQARWHPRMSHEEAKASLEARAILHNCANQILGEYGCPISREEMIG